MVMMEKKKLSLNCNLYFDNQEYSENNIAFTIEL